MDVVGFFGAIGHFGRLAGGKGRVGDLGISKFGLRFTERRFGHANRNVLRRPGGGGRLNGLYGIRVVWRNTDEGRPLRAAGPPGREKGPNWTAYTVPSRKND